MSWLATIVKSAVEAIGNSLIKAWESFRRDSAQQQLGGHKVKEAVQDETIEKLKKFAEIDNDERTVDDAADGLFGAEPERDE